MLAAQMNVEGVFLGLKFVLSPYKTNISSQHLEDQLSICTNYLKKSNLKYIQISLSVMFGLKRILAK